MQATNRSSGNHCRAQLDSIGNHIVVRHIARLVKLWRRQVLFAKSHLGGAR